MSIVGYLRPLVIEAPTQRMFLSLGLVPGRFGSAQTERTQAQPTSSATASYGCASICVHVFPQPCPISTVQLL